MKCVLLAGITGEREVACLNFVMTCIRLQTHLQQHPAIQVHISFFKHVNDALTQFYKESTMTHLVVVDTDKGCEPEFILAAADDNSSADNLVAGVYPLPGIDWDRVRTRQDDNFESLHAKGNIYNFDAQKATSVRHASALTTVAGLGVFRLSRHALLAFLDRHGSTVRAEDGSIVAFKESIMDGIATLPHETFCKLWGMPVQMDLRFPCTNTGKYPFAGAVGHRKNKIR